MARRKRPDPVVEQLRALRNGGLGALIAAEKIASGADDTIQIRINRTLKLLFAEEAMKSGHVRGGKPNISAWLISLGRNAIEKKGRG